LADAVTSLLATYVLPFSRLAVVRVAVSIRPAREPEGQAAAIALAALVTGARGAGRIFAVEHANACSLRGVATLADTVAGGVTAHAVGTLAAGAIARLPAALTFDQQAAPADFARVAAADAIALAGTDAAQGATIRLAAAGGAHDVG
jgi:hypothetical protein